MDEKNTTFLKLLSHKCDIEKKKNLTYISWSEAWAELKKIDEKASYTIYENSEGFPFRESKFGIDCKVGVTLNGLEHLVRLPVLDGANKSMRFEKQEYKVLKNIWENGKQVFENGKPKKEEVIVTIEGATTFDINTTIQRAFTKAIAMHGLGLYVYMGEDLPPKELEEFTKEKFEEVKDKITKNDLEKIKAKYILSKEVEKMIIDL